MPVSGKLGSSRTGSRSEQTPIPLGQKLPASLYMSYVVFVAYERQKDNEGTLHIQLLQATQISATNLEDWICYEKSHHHHQINST